MSLFLVCAVKDDRVTPSADWVEQVVRPSICPTCWALHPHLRGAPMDILIERTAAVHGDFLNPGHARGGLCIVSAALAHILDPYLALFGKGRVIIAGKVSPDYITLNARQEARLGLYDDGRSPYSMLYPCSRCGRRQENLVGQKYYHPGDIKPGVAYVRCAGLSLMVEKQVLTKVRAACKEKLGVEEVLPGPPLNWGDRPWPPPMTDAAALPQS